MKDAPVFELDPRSHSLWRVSESGDKTLVNLTRKAFQILHHLFSHRERVISHEELLESIWGDAEVQPEVIKSHILAVREALGDRANDSIYIQTVRGRGYRFVGSPQSVRLANDSSAPPADESRIVGRNSELGALGRLWESARASDAKLVLVSGEPGIGKSALIRRFLTHASMDSNAAVGVGHCLQTFGGPGVAYQPLREALQAICTGKHAAAAIRALGTLAPLWAVQMPTLFPEAHYAELNRARHMVPSRERLQAEACEFLKAMSVIQPLILVIEDVQWADFATLDFIAALTTQYRAARRLVILSCRARELEARQAELNQWISELLARDIAVEIALLPLTEEDTYQYIGGSDAAELAQATWARSGGNPLYLRAILDHLQAQGLLSKTAAGWQRSLNAGPLTTEVPDSLQRLIAALLDRLTNVQRRVLDGACVAGMTFNASICAQAVHLDPLLFEESCEELVRRSHFLSKNAAQELPGGDVVCVYAFNHALYRDVLYHRMAPLLRSHLHLAIGERTEQLFPRDQRSAHADELAFHFAEGRNWVKALEYYRMALKNAHRRFAYRDALAILDRLSAVLPHLPRETANDAELEFLERQAAIYGALHDDRALSVYSKLYERATEFALVAPQIRALLGSAHVASWHSTLEGLAYLDRALPLAGQLTEPILRSQTQITIHVRRIWTAGWSDTDAQVCEEAAQSLQQRGNQLADARAVLNLSMMRLVSTQYRRAHDQFRVSYRFLLDHADLDGESDVARAVWMCRVGMPWALIFLGQFAAAYDEYEDGIATFARNGDGSAALSLQIYRCLLLYFASDFDGVMQVCGPIAAQSVGEGAQAPHSPNFLPLERRLSIILCGLSELARGNKDSAWTLLNAADEAMSHVPVHLDWYWRNLLDWGIVQLLLLRRDQSGADNRADLLVKQAERTREFTWRSFAWQVKALAAANRGSYEEARVALERSFLACGDFETPLAELYALRAAVRVYEQLNDSAQADVHRKRLSELEAALLANIPDVHPLRRGQLFKP